MANSLLPLCSAGTDAFYCKSRLAACLALALSSPAFARDVKVPVPVFDATAARDFPQAIYDKIAARITYQTTFEQFRPDGLVRWSTRTLKLADFVKARSPTYPDTYLYAMRYVVTVVSEKDSLAVYGTSCQVVVVYKDKEWDEPTVACEPANLDRPLASAAGVF